MVKIILLVYNLFWSKLIVLQAPRLNEAISFNYILPQKSDRKSTINIYSTSQSLLARIDFPFSFFAFFSNNGTIEFIIILLTFN